MSIISLCAFAIVAAFVALTLRQHRPEMAALIGLAAVVLIFLAVADKLGPIIQALNGLFEQMNLPASFGGVIIKAIGICLIVQVASDACRDAGESSLASKLEIAGRLTIIFLALPLFNEVMQTALSLIKST
ncbi:MAG: stage III sporulation protein AD [Oscillospiraceae bacterium]|jgi:stage III sporulation protein AD|nr:stage III sporulation protein AD [Oscillospiraceae bacterium]